MNEYSPTPLAPLSEESIERIERAVFDAIEDAPPMRQEDRSRARSAPRPRRRWPIALGFAAAFVGGILVAPGLLDAVSQKGAGSAVQYESAPGPARDAAPEAADAAAGDASDAVGASGAVGADADSTGEDREIVSTADAALQVADVSAAADRIAALAEENGGYVEATDLAGRSDQAGISPEQPRAPGTGWISIRVPADRLRAVIGALDEYGEVLRSSISRQDVTSTALDLRARADAARASVERLTELMGKSGSVSDLIAAETALSERQAQLESYEQQVKTLDEQVALATLSVQLTERTGVGEADPAGFGDGLLAGWNGLVVALNALVVALGFLLPWLAIAGVVVTIVWLIRRRRTRAGAQE